MHFRTAAPVRLATASRLYGSCPGHRILLWRTPRLSSSPPSNLSPTYQNPSPLIKRAPRPRLASRAALRHNRRHADRERKTDRRGRELPGRRGRRQHGTGWSGHCREDGGLIALAPVVAGGRQTNWKDRACREINSTSYLGFCRRALRVPTLVVKRSTSGTSRKENRRKKEIQRM